MRRIFLVLLGSSLSVSNLYAQELESLPKKIVPTAPKEFDKPLDAKLLEASITEGVDFLVRTQKKSGAWGGPTKTKGLNIYAPIPGAHHGFRIGTSSIALYGLIKSGDTRPDTLKAIVKGEKWLLEILPRLRRADVSTTYNNWGHAYAMQALTALAQREGVSKEQFAKYKKLVKEQADLLFRYQDVDGGWGYLHFDGATQRPSGGSMCFTTSTVLVALKEAQNLFGLTYPEKRIFAAKRSVLEQRTPDFSYVYAYGHKNYPRKGINRPAGSLARTQVCNLAMRLWGDKKVTDEVVVKWLDRLVKRNGWLDIGRKRPVPHETHFSISGYFYYYGHFYAADCIHFLPEAQRMEWQHKLARIILDKQEKDGSWWDYPLYDYHQPYGTGFALYTLSKCRVK